MHRRGALKTLPNELAAYKDRMRRFARKHKLPLLSIIRTSRTFTRLAKRCPQCNRVETDEALKFCRVDRATLVSDFDAISGEMDTAKFGSGAVSSEIKTSILGEKIKLLDSLKSGIKTALVM